MKKILLYTIYLSCLLPVAYGQQDFYGWRIGVGGGYMNYYGDVSNYRIESFREAGKAFRLWNLDHNGISRDAVENRTSQLSSFSISVERRLSPTTSTQFQYTDGYVTGNDRLNRKGDLATDNRNFSRGLNFRTHVKDYSLGFVFTTANDRFLRSTAFFAPYLLVQAGYMELDVRGDLLDAQGNRYAYASDGSLPTGVRQDGMFETALRPLNTEAGNRYSRGTFHAGAGVGVRLRISSRIGVHVQSEFRYAFSDYIDDVSSSYRDSYDNPLAAYAANPTGVTRTYRGDNNQVNDIVAYHSLSVRYSFGREGKKAFKAPAIHVKTYAYNEPPLNNPYDTAATARMSVRQMDSLAAAQLAYAAAVMRAATTATDSATLARQNATDTVYASGNRPERPVPPAKSEAPENQTVVQMQNGRVTRIDVRNGNISIRMDEDSTQFRQSYPLARSSQSVVTDSIAGNRADTLEAPVRVTTRSRRTTTTRTDSVRTRTDSVARQTRASTQAFLQAEKRARQDSIAAARATRQPDTLTRFRTAVPSTRRTQTDTIIRKQQTQTVTPDTLGQVPKETLPTYDTASTRRMDEAYLRSTRRMDSLQTQMTRWEKRLDSLNRTQPAAAPATPSAADWEKDPVYRQNMSRVDSLQNRIRVLEKDIAANRRKKDAEATEARRQAEAERTAMQQEISRLHNETEQQRTVYTQPATDTRSRDWDEFQKTLRAWQQQTDQMQDQLQRERTYNRQLERDQRRFEQDMRSNRTRQQPAIVVPPATVQVQTSPQPSTQVRQTPVTGNKQTQEEYVTDSLYQRSSQAMQDSVQKLQQQLARLQQQIAVNNARPAAPEKEVNKAFDPLMVPPVSVYFPSGSVVVSMREKSKLQRLAQVLKDYPDTRVELTGMADATGNAVVNQRISRQRVEAVRTILQNTYRVPANRIDIQAIGASNASGAANPFDRKVEVTVTSKSIEE